MIMVRKTLHKSIWFLTLVMLLGLTAMGHAQTESRTGPSGQSKKTISMDFDQVEIHTDGLF